MAWRARCVADLQTPHTPRFPQHPMAFFSAKKRKEMKNIFKEKQKKKEKEKEKKKRKKKEKHFVKKKNEKQ